MFSKSYWTAKGAVSRLQLVLAYLGIVLAFAVSVTALNNDSKATQATIVRECKETNRRNIQTKATLVRLAAIDIAKAEESAKARHEVPELFKKEIEGRRDVTLALIDALAPVRDCENLIQDQ